MKVYNVCPPAGHSRFLISAFSFEVVDMTWMFPLCSDKQVLNRQCRINVDTTQYIKAVLGMLARGTEARKYGPMAEEAGSACDCKTKH